VSPIAAHLTLLRSAAVPPGAYTAKDLKALTVFAFGRQGVTTPVELTVDLTGHRRIQELNRRYRGVDRTTDVISFKDETAPHPNPLPQGEGGGARVRRSLQGDVAINVQQAAIQAKKMGHSTRREIRLLLIHGILHLLGYTDYEPRERRRMFARQNALLRSWEKERR